VTTGVLAEGIDPSQTSYPASGDPVVSLADVLAAAGKSTLCAGADFRVYALCRPARPPHRGPPPEAYAACHERTQAASCSLTLRGGETVDGKCVADRDGAAQFCLPDRTPPPPQD
jgi:hypothetical protein